MSGFPKTQKKVREARFFLARLSEKERTLRLDPEDFDFYLSAFLSASYSVSELLRAEFVQSAQGRRDKNQRRKTWDKWYSAWKDGLANDDREIWDFMPAQRQKEVHEKGAEVHPVVEMVPVTEIPIGNRSHPAYGITWSGPPGMPPPQVGQKRHYFGIGGTRSHVVETCTHFLTLLEELVGKCEEDLVAPE